jgi:hypothetical protein
MTIQTLKHPAFVLSLMAPLVLSGCGSDGNQNSLGALISSSLYFPRAESGGPDSIGCNGTTGWLSGAECCGLPAGEIWPAAADGYSRAASAPIA